MLFYDDMALQKVLSSSGIICCQVFVFNTIVYDFGIFLETIILVIDYIWLRCIIDQLSLLVYFNR